MGWITVDVNSINQQLYLPLLEEKRVSLFLKREDQIHPIISGNKYRKLKYNILEAQALEYEKLITFGGAYSNHIAATAFAGRIAKLKTIGIVRGEELASNWKENPTLKLANEQGMLFKFVTRKEYKLKEDPQFIKALEREFGTFYLLPEGGTNSLAVKGCEEIVTANERAFDFICCCVGTGGTIAGIINASNTRQKILGFPTVKDNFLKKDIRNFAWKENWDLLTDYHFGGYGKVTEELILFINKFKAQTQVSLDPIYTGKMLFGILDLVRKDFFPAGTRILAIHTGGLQGILGMNIILKRKKLPLLNI